jgi:hypothetical protein
VRATRFIPVQRSERNDPRQIDHVFQLTRVRQSHRGPQIRIIDRDAVVTVLELAQLVISLLQAIVIPDYSHVVGHDATHLFVKLVLVFVSRLRDQFIIQFLLPFGFLFVDPRAVRAISLDVAGPFNSGRRGDETTIDTTDERVGSEPVCSMN